MCSIIPKAIMEKFGWLLTPKEPVVNVTYNFDFVAYEQGKRDAEERFKTIVRENYSNASRSTR